MSRRLSSQEASEAARAHLQRTRGSRCSLGHPNSSLSQWYISDRNGVSLSSMTIRSPCQPHSVSWSTSGISYPTSVSSSIIPRTRTRLISASLSGGGPVIRGGGADSMPHICRPLRAETDTAITGCDQPFPMSVRVLPSQGRLGHSRSSSCGGGHAFVRHTTRISVRLGPMTSNPAIAERTRMSAGVGRRATRRTVFAPAEASVSVGGAAQRSTTTPPAARLADFKPLDAAPLGFPSAKTDVSGPLGPIPTMSTSSHEEVGRALFSDWAHRKQEPFADVYKGGKDFFADLVKQRRDGGHQPTALAPKAPTVDSSHSELFMTTISEMGERDVPETSAENYMMQSATVPSMTTTTTAIEDKAPLQTMTALTYPTSSEFDSYEFSKTQAPEAPSEGAAKETPQDKAESPGGNLVEYVSFDSQSKEGDTASSAPAAVENMIGTSIDISTTKTGGENKEALGESLPSEKLQDIKDLELTQASSAHSVEAASARTEVPIEISSYGYVPTLAESTFEAPGATSEEHQLLPTSYEGPFTSMASDMTEFPAFDMSKTQEPDVSRQLTSLKEPYQGEVQMQLVERPQADESAQVQATGSSHDLEVSAAAAAAAAAAGYPSRECETFLPPQSAVLVQQAETEKLAKEIESEEIIPMHPHQDSGRASSEQTAEVDTSASEKQGGLEDVTEQRLLQTEPQKESDADFVAKDVHQISEVASSEGSVAVSDATTAEKHETLPLTASAKLPIYEGSSANEEISKEVWNVVARQSEPDSELMSSEQGPLPEFSLTRQPDDFFPQPEISVSGADENVSAREIAKESEEREIVPRQEDEGKEPAPSESTALVEVTPTAKHEGIPFAELTTEHADEDHLAKQEHDRESWSTVTRHPEYDSELTSSQQAALSDVSVTQQPDYFLPQAEIDESRAAEKNIPFTETAKQSELTDIVLRQEDRDSELASSLSSASVETKPREKRDDKPFTETAMDRMEEDHLAKPEHRETWSTVVGHPDQDKELISSEQPPLSEVSMTQQPDDFLPYTKIAASVEVKPTAKHEGVPLADLPTEPTDENVMRQKPEKETWHTSPKHTQQGEQVSTEPTPLSDVSATQQSDDSLLQHSIMPPHKENIMLQDAAKQEYQGSEPASSEISSVVEVKAIEKPDGAPFAELMTEPTDEAILGRRGLYNEDMVNRPSQQGEIVSTEPTPLSDVTTTQHTNDSLQSSEPTADENFLKRETDIKSGLTKLVTKPEDQGSEFPSSEHAGVVVASTAEKRGIAEAIEYDSEAATDEYLPRKKKSEAQDIIPREPDRDYVQTSNELSTMPDTAAEEKIEGTTQPSTDIEGYVLPSHTDKESDVSGTAAKKKEESSDLTYRTDEVGPSPLDGYKEQYVETSLVPITEDEIQVTPTLLPAYAATRNKLEEQPLIETTDFALDDSFLKKHISELPDIEAGQLDKSSDLVPFEGTRAAGMAEEEKCDESNSIREVTAYALPKEQKEAGTVDETGELQDKADIIPTAMVPSTLETSQVLPAIEYISTVAEKADRVSESTAAGSEQAMMTRSEEYLNAAPVEAVSREQQPAAERSVDYAAQFWDSETMQLALTHMWTPEGGAVTIDKGSPGTEIIEVMDTKQVPDVAASDGPFSHSESERKSFETSETADALQVESKLDSSAIPRITSEAANEASASLDKAAVNYAAQFWDGGALKLQLMNMWTPEGGAIIAEGVQSDDEAQKRAPALSDQYSTAQKQPTDSWESPSKEEPAGALAPLQFEELHDSPVKEIHLEPGYLKQALSKELLSDLKEIPAVPEVAATEEQAEGGATKALHDERPTASYEEGGVHTEVVGEEPTDASFGGAATGMTSDRATDHLEGEPETTEEATFAAEQHVKDQLPKKEKDQEIEQPVSGSVCDKLDDAANEERGPLLSVMKTEKHFCEKTSERILKRYGDTKPMESVTGARESFVIAETETQFFDSATGESMIRNSPEKARAEAESSQSKFESDVFLEDLIGKNAIEPTEPSQPCDYVARPLNVFDDVVAAAATSTSEAVSWKRSPSEDGVIEAESKSIKEIGPSCSKTEVQVQDNVLDHINRADEASEDASLKSPSDPLSPPSISPLATFSPFPEAEFTSLTYQGQYVPCSSLDSEKRGAKLLACTKDSDPTIKTVVDFIATDSDAKNTGECAQTTGASGADQGTVTTSRCGILAYTDPCKPVLTIGARVDGVSKPKAQKRRLSFSDEVLTSNDVAYREKHNVAPTAKASPPDNILCPSGKQQTYTILEEEYSMVDKHEEPAAVGSDTYVMAGESDEFDNGEQQRAGSVTQCCEFLASTLTQSAPNDTTIANNATWSAENRDDGLQRPVYVETAFEDAKGQLKESLLSVRRGSDYSDEHFSNIGSDETAPLCRRSDAVKVENNMSEISSSRELDSSVPLRAAISGSLGVPSTERKTSLSSVSVGYTQEPQVNDDNTSSYGGDALDDLDCLKMRLFGSSRSQGPGNITDDEIRKNELTSTLSASHIFDVEAPFPWEHTRSFDSETVYAPAIVLKDDAYRMSVPSSAVTEGVADAVNKYDVPPAGNDTMKSESVLSATFGDALSAKECTTRQREGQQDANATTQSFPMQLERSRNEVSQQPAIDDRDERLLKSASAEDNTHDAEIPDADDENPKFASRCEELRFENFRTVVERMADLSSRSETSIVYESFVAPAGKVSDMLGSVYYDTAFKVRVVDDYDLTSIMYDRWNDGAASVAPTIKTFWTYSPHTFLMAVDESGTHCGIISAVVFEDEQAFCAANSVKTEFLAEGTKRQLWDALLSVQCGKNLFTVVPAEQVGAYYRQLGFYTSARGLILHGKLASSTDLTPLGQVSLPDGIEIVKFRKQMYSSLVSFDKSTLGFGRKRFWKMTLREGPISFRVALQGGSGNAEVCGYAGLQNDVNGVPVVRWLVASDGQVAVRLLHNLLSGSYTFRQRGAWMALYARSHASAALLRHLDTSGFEPWMLLFNRREPFLQYKNIAVLTYI
ncbi:hypothetical protein HPB50_006388 [Hyalomma asiaticum]|uniref:Uncharacterized protein n=1 Tax=Hyalomma asiaticum TaxID=266040 RepID=A0ACB7SW50_HYAAI|nr:hypothetical protein HPB50_006388 [Hyalomma asiaticum]